MSPGPDDLTTRPASSGAGPGAAPHDPAGAAAVRGRWVRRLLIATGCVVASLSLLAAAAIAYTWWRVGQVERHELDLGAVGHDEPRNYLVVGSDTREVLDENAPNADAFFDESYSGGRRSDTIMIARVDARARTVDLVSVPRDLWVPIPGTGTSERINTAYASGGPQLLVDTISENLGVEIHHYVEIDFASFKQVVAAVDGVPMWFETPMRDTHSGFYALEPGCVTLDPDQALAFARSRHFQVRNANGRWEEDPTGDLGRITRQQQLVREVVDRGGQKLSRLDLRSANELLLATVQHVSVDAGLGIEQMWVVGQQFRGYSGDQIRSHSLPVEQDATAGGASILRLDRVAAQPVLNIFRGIVPGEAPAVDPSRVALTIHNGSGVDGQAGEAEVAFEALGYTVVGIGDSPRPSPVTVVRHAPGDEQVAAAVAAHLPGARLVVDPTHGQGKVTVVTGSDFTTVAGAATAGTAAGSGTTPGTVEATTTTTLDPGPVGLTPGTPPPGVTCD